MLAFLGTPDMITVLFFLVSYQTVFYENVNAVPSLLLVNLLLLTKVGVGFFLRLWKFNWIIFYITLLCWEFLLKWYNLF